MHYYTPPMGMYAPSNVSPYTFPTSAAIPLEELTMTTNPASGSVIIAFEYQEHIEIQCSFSEGMTVVNTVWTLQLANDMEISMWTYVYVFTNPWGDHRFSALTGEIHLYVYTVILHPHHAGGSGSGGLPSEMEIISDTDPYFSVEGSGNSLLIIDVFAPELNGSTIICRDDMFTLEAYFIVRSIRTYE